MQTHPRPVLFRIAGFSILIFPLLLLIGFLMHPDLFSFEIVSRPEQLVRNFHHQWMFHVGHLIVAFSIPFIIISVCYFALILSGKGFFYGLVGGIIALFGATVLGLDKGSLCLVLSGFDTLPESEFQAFTPFLQVLIDKKGLLSLNGLIALLPLGAIIQAVGLWKEQVVAPWQGTVIILGLLLLNNPDIELISSLGAALMIVGYSPMGIKLLSAPA